MDQPGSSTPNRILARASAGGRGSVFTPSDFLDLAERPAVDQALSRLSNNGKLRRLARGLYDLPKFHPTLGPLSPDPDHVARALARETGSKVQIGGARAAHLLGLTPQVPAQSDYLTDGPSRRVVLGKRVIHLRHVSPKHLILPGSAAGSVVQALRHLGPTRADDVVRIAARSLPVADKKELAASVRQAPGWMRPTLLAITALDPNAVSDKARYSKRDLAP